MKEQFNCGIYKITNLINNKIYIGQSINISKRFREHKLKLNLHKHGNIHIQRTYDKYGMDFLKFEIIFICSMQDLDSTEIYFIKHYNSNNRDFGYNIYDGGNGARGFKHTKETKKKMSISHSGDKNYNFGKKISPEIREIMQQAQLKIATPERNHKLRLAQLGRKEIYQIDMNTNQIIAKYSSIREASSKLNINRTTIQFCCKNKRNKKSAGGYKWKFA